MSYASKLEWFSIKMAVSILLDLPKHQLPGNSLGTYNSYTNLVESYKSLKWMLMEILNG